MRPQGFNEDYVPLQTYNSDISRSAGGDTFHVANDLQYDRATGTKKICIGGLVFSVIVGAGFIGVGSLFKGPEASFTLSPVALELIPLGTNFVMLLITECLGYIHTTSLRWALFREDRLEFNANLRLVTFSKRSLANGVVANILYSITLAICYSGASMIHVRNTSDFFGSTDHSEQHWNTVKNNVSLSKVVPTTLGTAILIQCILSAWCLWTAQIPTWSSDPSTTLKEAAASTGLVRRPGRCMMSIHDKNKPATPTQPRIRQLSPYGISSKVLSVLIICTIVLGLLII